MRTAFTLAKKADGSWVIASDPDKIPADKQRTAFDNLGQHWPKDVEEIRFITSDGKFKVKHKGKAESAARNLKQAEHKAQEKLDLAARHVAEAKAKAEADAEAKKKAEADARARELKAKADAKLATTLPKVEIKPAKP